MNSACVSLCVLYWMTDWFLFLISARMLVFDVKYLEESWHCVVIGSPVKAHKFRTPVCLSDALSWECWSVSALFAKIAVWLPRSLFFGRFQQFVGAGVRRRLAGWEFHSCTWKKSGGGMVNWGWEEKIVFFFLSEHLMYQYIVDEHAQAHSVNRNRHRVSYLHHTFKTGSHALCLYITQQMSVWQFISGKVGMHKCYLHRVCPAVQNNRSVFLELFGLAAAGSCTAAPVCRLFWFCVKWLSKFSCCDCALWIHAKKIHDKQNLVP